MKTRPFHTLLSDESGQATLEYIMVLLIALGSVIAIAKTVVYASDEGILKFGATLERDLKSGRENVIPIWKN